MLLPLIEYRYHPVKVFKKTEPTEFICDSLSLRTEAETDPLAEQLDMLLGFSTRSVGGALSQQDVQLICREQRYPGA